MIIKISSIGFGWEQRRIKEWIITLCIPLLAWLSNTLYNLELVKNSEIIGLRFILGFCLPLFFYVFLDNIAQVLTFFDNNQKVIASLIDEKINFSLDFHACFSVSDIESIEYKYRAWLGVISWPTRKHRIIVTTTQGKQIFETAFSYGPLQKFIEIVGQQVHAKELQPKG